MEYPTTPSGLVMSDRPTHLMPEYEIYASDEEELVALRKRKEELRLEVAREKQDHGRTLEVLRKSSEEKQACLREMEVLRAELAALRQELQQEKAELSSLLLRGCVSHIEQEKAEQAQAQAQAQAQGGGYRKRKSTKKRRKKTRRRRR